MGQFIKGMDLCRGFFHQCAEGILREAFPDLRYSAGLIGYGSDVLGYDDKVSTDHMWGPRFYLFLREEDLGKKAALLERFGEKLPYTYQGYSVHFTEPDPNDNGVRRPEFRTSGKVHPLIFIQTFRSFLTEQLGAADLDDLSPGQWLAFSEHRLLSLVSGQFFADDLGCAQKLSKIRYYPDCVKRYLAASNWDCVATEQAFVKRCGAYGDEIGSRLICARICERLMRLCFLYRETYAPYSKWFGTAFSRLELPAGIKEAIGEAIAAGDCLSREEKLVEAQALVADLHNASGLTERVSYQRERYFSRDIQVIFADKFAAAAAKGLAGTPLEKAPLMGSFSQLGGLSSLSDDPQHYARIARFYQEPGGEA